MALDTGPVQMDRIPQGMETVMASFNERTAGTYRCTFAKLDEDFEITDRTTGERAARWRWVFQETSDPTTVGEIDTLTSVGFRKGSNGLRFLMGMLGRPPQEGDSTDALIGQEFDVQYGPNRAGTLSIVGVVRPDETRSAAAGTTLAPLPAAASSTANDGPLPF
jgi:hypothetical protein